MPRFVKIGSDIINLDAITRVSVVENQSGMSDRLVIQLGEVTVNVDSATGREEMLRVQKRLSETLRVEDWNI
jgi:hypothetical protein